MRFTFYVLILEKVQYVYTNISLIYYYHYYYYHYYYYYYYGDDDHHHHHYYYLLFECPQIVIKGKHLGTSSSFVCSFIHSLYYITTHRHFLV